MTLHQKPLKTEVGIRELHNSLSKYVQHVATGKEVFVTMRGKRVARLAPVDDVDPLASLRERGLLREPTGFGWGPRRSGRPKPSRSVADIVSEQRN